VDVDSSVSAAGRVGKRAPAESERVERHLVLTAGGRPGRPAAYPIKSGIDNDPMQPGCNSRISAKAVSPAECGDHRVLKRFGCLLRIIECTDGNSPEPIPMPPEQLAECIWMARHVPPEKLSVGQTPLLS
jgi:hypothetical protein